MTPLANSVSSSPPASRLAAIALMCAALVCFACLDTSAKFLSRALPTPEIAWARYAGAAVFAFFLSGAHKNPKVWVSRRPGLQALRSTLLLISTVANFFAVSRLQLAETSTIAFLQPMFVALMAGPLIGEKMGGAQLAAIFVGFLGVLVAMQPGTSAYQPIVFVSIVGVMANAGYALATRRLAHFDPAPTTLAWTQVAGVVVLTPTLPYLWKTPPGALNWAVFLGAGLIGAVGHRLMIIAHLHAPAGALAPFTYTQLLWMVTLGYLVFGDIPPSATLIGAGIVVACGLYLVAHERRAAGLR